MSNNEPGNKHEWKPCKCGKGNLFIEQNFLTGHARVQCGGCGKTGPTAEDINTAVQRWNSSLSLDAIE